MSASPLKAICDAHAQDTRVQRILTEITRAKKVECTFPIVFFTILYTSMDLFVYTSIMTDINAPLQKKKWISLVLYFVLTTLKKISK
jgi:hypothetical protein